MKKIFREVQQNVFNECFSQSVSLEQHLGQVVDHLPAHGLVAVHVARVADLGQGTLVLEKGPSEGS